MIFSDYERNSPERQIASQGVFFHFQNQRAGRMSDSRELGPEIEFESKDHFFHSFKFTKAAFSKFRQTTPRLRNSAQIRTRGYCGPPFPTLVISSTYFARKLGNEPITLFEKV